MSPTEAYLKAIEALGRPRHDLRPVYPDGWKESDRAVAMLVLVGGRDFKSGDWPAVALMLGPGAYALGNSIPEAAFPRRPDVPRIFEGHQCLLQVGEEVRLLKDVSTNGTFVISPGRASQSPSGQGNKTGLHEKDLQNARTIRPNDIVLTAYAELLLVRL